MKSYQKKNVMGERLSPKKLYPFSKNFAFWNYDQLPLLCKFHVVDWCILLVFYWKRSLKLTIFFLWSVDKLHAILHGKKRMILFWMFQEIDSFSSKNWSSAWKFGDKYIVIYKKWSLKKSVSSIIHRKWPILSKNHEKCEFWRSFARKKMQFLSKDCEKKKKIQIL